MCYLEGFTKQDPVLAFTVPTMTCPYTLKDRLESMLQDNDQQ